MRLGRIIHELLSPKFFFLHAPNPTTSPAISRTKVLGSGTGLTADEAAEIGVAMIVDAL